MKFNVTPVAGSVPFDNSTNGFTATDVQAAIEESGIGRFPRRKILTAETFHVYDEDVMVVYQELDIQGELDNEGEVAIIV